MNASNVKKASAGARKDYAECERDAAKRRPPSTYVVHNEEVAVIDGKCLHLPQDLSVPWRRLGALNEAERVHSKFVANFESLSSDIPSQSGRSTARG